MSRRRRILRAVPGVLEPAAPAVVPERFRWELNGTDESLELGSNSNLGIANQFSILLNVRLDSVAATDRSFVDIGPVSSNNNRILIQWNDSPTGFRVVLFNSAGTLFKARRWATSVFTVGGDAAHLLITFDGSAPGDPVVLYLNGSALSADDGTDNTGTLTNTNRKVFLACDQLSGSFLPGAIQDAAIAGSVLSAGAAATLYGQVNDADPLSGVAFGHHWTPQASGAAQYEDQIGSLDLTPTNMDATNRVQGNLITL